MQTFNRIIFLTGVFYLFSISVITGQKRQEGELVYDGIPEIPEKISLKLHQYQNARSASLEDWLPDGEGMLITTRFGNTNQFHTVLMPGGARNQITFFEDPVKNGAFCSNQEYNGFLFLKDVGGNDMDQFFWYDMDKRESKMITDGESLNLWLSWATSGDKFSYTSTRRNGKDFDIYVANIANPLDAELVIDKGDGFWISSDWSPDDKKILLIQLKSTNQSSSFILEFETGELTPISPLENETMFSALAWDAKGEHVYSISNQNTENTTLVRTNIKTGMTENLLPGILWDVDGFDNTKDRTKAAFTLNEGGFSQLYLLDMNTGKYEKVKGLPFGQIYPIQYHPERDELAFAINSPQSPGDVYSRNIKNAELKRWTNSEVGGLDTDEFPKPELIHYPSFDSVDGQPRKIPAYVYKPKKGDEAVPVMIFIHGGPESQHMPTFNSFFSYLTNELGIAVIAPNVRGSIGYGKTYLNLDNGFNREESVKDIGALLNWIENQKVFDQEKVAVYGASYGGYMVLASMIHFNDKIKCGVDIVGISNFVTFLENTSEDRKDFRRAEYGDERDPEMREFLLSISPTTHADEITKPLFVIQGANDRRVPMSEAEQIVNAVRNNDGVVWYMLAKDEGHGFDKKDNEDRRKEAVIYFLEKYLLE